MLGMMRQGQSFSFPGVLIPLFSFSLSFVIMTKTDYKIHAPFHNAH